MGGGLGMWDILNIDIPNLCQLFNMSRIFPVAERDQFSISTAFTRVLCSWLTIHLENCAARFPDHPTNQMHIVNLNRRSCCLVGLINSLQDCRYQCGSFPDDFCNFL